MVVFINALGSETVPDYRVSNRRRILPRGAFTKSRPHLLDALIVGFLDFGK
jgi:hypothetical protein